MTKSSKKNFFMENKLENKPAVKLNKEPLRVLPKVNFTVFSKVSGIKEDQLAGLGYYAKEQDIRVLTISEWKNLLKEYNNKPVN